MLTRVCALMGMLIGVTAAVAQEASPPPAAEMQVLQEKQTTLGLHVTAREAYEMWRAEPEKIRILDVRTPEEYWFVGHAPMARNIPLSFVTRQWDADKNAYVMQPNADFVTQVKEHYQPADTLLVVCRSGGRSKKAVDLLSKEGFSNVYNVIDGMEGDTVQDPASVFQGKRMKNGWKNAGLPWTYELDPELAYRGGDADRP